MFKKKLGNKGFAITSVLYTLLVAFLLFLGAALAEFSTSAKLLSKANEDLTDGFDIKAVYYDAIGNEINTYSINVSDFPYDYNKNGSSFSLINAVLVCGSENKPIVNQITYGTVKSTCKGASNVKLEYTVELIETDDVEPVYKLGDETYDNMNDLIEKAKNTPPQGKVFTGPDSVEIKYTLEDGSESLKPNISYSNLESEISNIKSSNNNLKTITVIYKPKYEYVCTSNNQNVVAGSLITCDEQKFYVLSNNGTSVKTIAQYALKKQSDDNYKQGKGLSDCEKVQFDDGKNGNVPYKPDSKNGKYYGYWKSSYSSNTQYYNLDLNISLSVTNKLISNYVTYLKGLTGNNSISGDLMNYSTYNSNYNYSWFPKNTDNGWLKTASSNRHVYIYSCTSSVCKASTSVSYPDYSRCVTPVITIPISIIGY